jgi:hypothetical protein
MPKEEARENNNVFELNTAERKPIDKGFKANEIPNHVRHPLA